MKNFTLLRLSLLALGIITVTGLSAQVTIFSEGLNNSSSFFTVSGGTYFTGNSGTDDRPASSPFFSEGTYAYGISNGTATLTSSNIDVSSYTSISLTFRLSSFSIGSSGNGADGTDLVTVEISPNGGTTYYSTLTVGGNSNAYWAYSTGTGNASTSYDGDSNPIAFKPLAGGNRTTDGYSTVTINNIPQVSNLKIKITLLNNSANERWVIDDINFTGIPASGCGCPYCCFSTVNSNPRSYNYFCRLIWKRFIHRRRR